VKRKNLLKTIKQAGLTYTAVGKSVGVTRQMISHIIYCRHNPSWSLQQRLVAYFAIPAEILFEIDEDDKSAIEKEWSKNMEGKKAGCS